MREMMREGEELRIAYDRCSRRRFEIARGGVAWRMSPKRPRSGESRAYGDDNYWINRFEKSSSNDEETDEWLLSWSQLSPLFDLPAIATVIDSLRHVLAADRFASKYCGCSCHRH